MAKYKIIPSSRTIVQSPISIGHKAEKGVEAIEFDLTAWVETYGSGTATIVMKRWGDSIPYPVALEIDENNKATWTLSDTDTAKAGMAYAQLNYIVGDEVVKKSDIYTFRVMDSLTGEGDPPEAYESWLEHLTHLAAEAMAEVLDIEGIVTDKTLTVDGGIADAKATGDALSALEDQFTEETDKLKADLGTLDDNVKSTVEDPERLLNAEPVSNLYNALRKTDGYSINTSNGTLTENNSYSVTDYIVVLENATYWANISGRVAFYNSQKEFISASSNIMKIETPTNTHYLRFDFPTSRSADFCIYSGIFKQAVPPKKFIIKYPWMPSDNVNAGKFENVYFLNLFNKTTALDGYYVNRSNGARETSSSYFVSDFIPVKENTNYKMSVGGNYACYDKHKQFLSGGNLSGNHKEFTTPNNAEYIIVSTTPLTLKNSLVIAESEHYTTEYKPYSIVVPWINTDKEIEVTPYDIKGGVFLNLFDKTTAVDGYYVESTTGSYNNANQYYWRSGFIPVKPNTSYTMSANNRCAFYDSDFVFIEGYNGQNVVTSPQNASYIMVCNAPLDTKNNFVLAESTNYESTYNKYGIKIPWLILDCSKSKYDGKKLVCFGDSITNYGYTSVIKEDTGIDAINVGLSSGRYAYSDDSNQYVNAFAFHNIVDAINTGDWTIPDSLEGVSGYETQYAHIQDIKAIDFSEVEFVSIAYGTNDFSSATPLDNENDPLDTDTFKGAIRYCLKTLTEKYPHLKIIGVTPCYRFWSENGSVLYDSDTHAVGGMMITQYVQAVEDVYTEYHLPVVNNYSNAGINKYNRLEYFAIADGLHPNAKGREIIGHRIGAGILENY